MGTLAIPAKTENLDSVLAFFENELANYEVSPAWLTKMEIVVEELFVNIAHYAYSSNPDGGIVQIQCDVDADENTLWLQFRDHGIPFDPLAKTDPDTSLPVEDRPIGGLGIFIVKKSVDEINYEYKDGQNVLSMKKKLDTP